MPTPILSIAGLSKSFPGVKALSSVDMTVGRGEIVAIVGQNGCGKSTLVKVLAGLYEPDAGSSITVARDDGNIVDISQAREEIRFIHQDLGLIPDLSTVENMSLSVVDGAANFVPRSARRERADAESAIARFGGRFDVTLPISELTAAERTIVAIARSLRGWESHSGILVLDEPTAALHRSETQQLFEAVSKAAASGAGIIFISHRLDEIKALADRVIALRDGIKTAEMTADSLDEQSLVRAIAGKAVSTEIARGTKHGGSAVLEVENLSSSHLESVSFTSHAGEILGVTGILGSGSEQIAAAIFGSHPRGGGTVRVKSKRVPGASIKKSIRAGIAFAPADRRGKGIVTTLDVRENLTLPRLEPLVGPFWRLVRAQEDAELETWFDSLAIRPREPGKIIGTLSGGNQQKVVIAKWLRTNPAVFLLDEPTQGIDVEAKALVHRKLREIAEQGTAVLLSSTDTGELVAVCDRVLVFEDGRLTKELVGAQITEPALIMAAHGVAEATAS